MHGVLQMCCFFFYLCGISLPGKYVLYFHKRNGEHDMCGRYRFPTGSEIRKFQDMIDTLTRLNLAFARGTVTPGMNAAVIARNRRMETSPFVMHWGYTLTDGKLVFNARSETAHEKKMFSDGIKQRRCVVPAESWYEWEHRGDTAQKYEIAPSFSEGIWLAGIYRLEEKGPSFSILTRDSAPDIAFIHDRMPVVIPDDGVDEWLDPSTDADRFLKAAYTEMSYIKKDD